MSGWSEKARVRERPRAHPHAAVPRVSERATWRASARAQCTHMCICGVRKSVRFHTWTPNTNGRRVGSAAYTASSPSCARGGHVPHARACDRGAWRTRRARLARGMHVHPHYVMHVPIHIAASAGGMHERGCKDLRGRTWNSSLHKPADIMWQPGSVSAPHSEIISGLPNLACTWVSLASSAAPISASGCPTS